MSNIKNLVSTVFGIKKNKELSKVTRPATIVETSPLLNMAEPEEQKHFFLVRDSVSQPHEMVMMLINAYPQGVEIDAFRRGQHGIKQPYQVVKNVRAYLKDYDMQKIVTIEKEYISKHKRKSSIGYYMISCASTYHECLELEKKLRKEKKA